MLIQLLRNWLKKEDIQCEPASETPAETTVQTRADLNITPQDIVHLTFADTNTSAQSSAATEHAERVTAALHEHSDVCLRADVFLVGHTSVAFQKRKETSRAILERQPLSHKEKQHAASQTPVAPVGFERGGALLPSAVKYLKGAIRLAKAIYQARNPDAEVPSEGPILDRFRRSLARLCVSQVAGAINEHAARHLPQVRQLPTLYETCAVTPFHAVDDDCTADADYHT